MEKGRKCCPRTFLTHSTKVVLRPEAEEPTLMTAFVLKIRDCDLRGKKVFGGQFTEFGYVTMRWSDLYLATLHAATRFSKAVSKHAMAVYMLSCCDSNEFHS